jgi:NADPH:quinone reductase-like Zn-dependent oxidoreductase
MHGPAIGWCRLRRARRVGKLIVELSRHRGIRTINVVRRRAAVSEIYERGGTEVICTEDEDLAARVTDVVGVDGVRKALDCVAGQLGADVFRALASEGELIVYGAMSTHRHVDASALTIPLFARSVICSARRMAPIERFADAVTLAEAPGHGAKPLFVFH